MWLRTPEAVENVLWEGPLEPATDEIVERAQREFAERGLQAAGRDLFRNLPLASIGQPEVWPLLELYRSGEPPPAHLLAKMEEADFYLVRFSCSFRPRGRGRIKWAGFIVSLLPYEERQPIVFDLHPREVYQEVQRQVKISLSPALNFQPVEIGSGGAEFGIEYPDLQPIITTSGIGEYDATWEYEEQRGRRLQGVKIMHLLVKAPKGMMLGEATLNLEAEIETFGVLSVHIIRRENVTPLKAQLWGVKLAN